MIKVLTHYTPSWKDLAEITIPISELYCSKHGYSINAYECSPYQHYNGKEKLRHILEGLNDNDIALVMDADSIITNLTIKIESFIDNKHDFYISNHLGKCNAGVFIIRLTKWSRKFIDYLLENIGKEKVYCEQDAIQKYQSENPNNPKIKILTHPSINSFNYNLYPEHPDITEESQGMWNKGNFILHLPGVGITERKKILTNIKEQIIYE